MMQAILEQEIAKIPCPGCERDRPAPFRYYNELTKEDKYLCGDCYENAVEMDNQIAFENHRDREC